MATTRIKQFMQKHRVVLAALTALSVSALLSATAAALADPTPSAGATGARPDSPRQAGGWAIITVEDVGLAAEDAFDPECAPETLNAGAADQPAGKAGLLPSAGALALESGSGDLLMATPAGDRCRAVCAAKKWARELFCPAHENPSRCYADAQLKDENCLAGCKFYDQPPQFPKPGVIVTPLPPLGGPTAPPI